jgi:hypothetical protein
MRYDPNVPPVPSEWLALDETQRIALAQGFHHNKRFKAPRIGAHALIHSVVETQIALGIQQVVDALGRLQGEGLDRHDAIYAIGGVLLERLSDAQLADPKFDDPNAWYYQALDRLTVREWRSRYGSSPDAG